MYRNKSGTTGQCFSLEKHLQTPRWSLLINDIFGAFFALYYFMNMNRIPQFLTRHAALLAAGWLLLLGTSSCTTASRVGVTNDFDHAVNFRAYKTWSWYPQQPGDAESGPAKGYESFLDKRLRAAVATEMTQKGLTEVDKAPDIYVAYSARVEDKQQRSCSRPCPRP